MGWGGGAAKQIGNRLTFTLRRRVQTGSEQNFLPSETQSAWLSSGYLIVRVRLRKLVVINHFLILEVPRFPYLPRAPSLLCKERHAALPLSLIEHLRQRHFLSPRTTRGRPSPRAPSSPPAPTVFIHLDSSGWGRWGVGGSSENETLTVELSRSHADDDDGEGQRGALDEGGRETDKLRSFGAVCSQTSTQPRGGGF